MVLFSLFQKQNREVAQKLGIATALMVTVPILAFYLSLHFLFHEKKNPEAWAGILAVICVNLVIIGYTVSAFSEEDDDVEPERGGHRSVGAFKTRTD